MANNEKSLNPTKLESAGEIASIAFNAVPVVGGVLSGIADSIIEKRQNRRLNNFLVSIAGDLQALENRMNQEFLQSEDFEDLAEDIFSKAAETRQQEKLQAFKAIFMNTLLSSSPSYNEAAEMADLVDQWQARHIILLKVLANPLSVDEQMGRPVGEGGSLTTSISKILKKLLPDWDDDQIDRTWQDLYDKHIHNTPGTKTMMTDKGIYQLENRLTEYGQKVVGFICQ